MIKRYYRSVLILLLIAFPFFLPHQVDARNKRLQYENAAYRYKRASHSPCIGLTCMYEAGLLKDPLSGTHTDCMGNSVNNCDTSDYNRAAANGDFIPGYYIGNVYNPDTGSYDLGYIPVAVFPKGGPSGEGPPGNPPPPTAGIVRIRARSLAGTPSSCSDVYASSTYINATINISPRGVPGSSQTSSGSDYAAWYVLPGTETISAVPPPNFVLKMACWAGTSPTTSGTGLSAPVAAGQTVTWDLGYINGAAWPQTAIGDVYAFADISSYIPTSATPRKFLVTVPGQTAGIVTYGTSADFDADLAGTGATYVSSNNWLAKDQYGRTDYYQLMYRRFGAPTTINYDHPTSPITQATSSATPYYAVGDITTSGNWLVPDGESLIFLVDGNLTIGGKIQTTGTGFVAFIVNGNITVSPSVGGAYNSLTPVVQGVYITSPNGVFATGKSTVAGTERFIGQGVFVAGEFQNERDLSDIGGTNYNNAYAAELYGYDPQILITMPDAMKNANIVWQEVAP